MNTKFLSIAIILLSSFASIGSAYAKGQATPHQRELNRCNTAVHVAAAKLKAQFNTVDSNQNGSLEKIETAVAEIAARCFRHLDSNNDGKLSAVELQHIS